jgi:hypothetical protein
MWQRLAEGQEGHLRGTIEYRHKRCEFVLAKRGKTCRFKRIFPGAAGEKVGKANRKSQEIREVT